MNMTRPCVAIKTGKFLCLNAVMFRKNKMSDQEL